MTDRVRRALAQANPFVFTLVAGLAGFSTYFAKLSQASKPTLRLQGGPMSAGEIAAFRRRPFHADAVRLRLWADAGKDADVRTPRFDAFRPLLRRVAGQD